MTSRQSESLPHQARPHGPDTKRDRPLHKRWATPAAVAAACAVVQIVFNLISIRGGSDQFDATIGEIQKQSETFSQILKDQQRARMSFRVEVEELHGNAGFRIINPFAMGGTTEARHVVFKNHVSSAPPGQPEYMSSPGIVDLDWEAREGHALSDVSPTETDRNFVMLEPLSRQQLAAIIADETSLYVIGRLEYCDIYERCRYFMRCAEIGGRFGLVDVSYCGTEIDDLDDTAD